MKQLALVLGFGAIMGLAGPFGTYPALDRPVRYAFWIGLVLAGYTFALGATRLAELFPGTARAGRLTITSLIALASAVPMTFVVAWTFSLVQPGRVIAPTQLPLLFTCVTAVQIIIVVALIRPIVAPSQPGPPLHPTTAAQNESFAGAPMQTGNLNQPERPAVTENSTAVAAAESAVGAREIEASSNAPPTFPAVLLSRVPRELGPEVVALEAEDHYVRVYTLKGSTLVLMRLSDAVDLLDDAIGLRVHRSWWVARQAIESFDRDGQQLMLRITNGAQIPVGRTYVAAVRIALRDR